MKLALRLGRRLAPAVLAALFALASHAAAADSLIATDGSLGGVAVEVGAGVDSLGQPADYLIGAELGALRGDNLFHSFDRFGIRTNEVATFDGPGSVRNVIARVTGGAASNIDGTLRSAMPLADVWLLNPSGIVFGEHAQLDVPGSFHAGTADYLEFEPGGERFYANPLQLSSILSAAQPSAFGFLPETIAAAPIEVTGSTLSVSDGKTLELAGGDITLTGADLVADAGTVLLRGGRIEILDDSHVLAENVDSPTPGRIEVAASESLLVDGSLLSVNTTGSGDAGTIDIASPMITIQNGPGLSSPDIPQVTPYGVRAETTSDGAGGSIRVRADQLMIRNGVAVSVDAVGALPQVARGAAGSIGIEANSIDLSGRSFIGAAGWGSTGSGGTITIDLGDGSLRIDGRFRDAAISTPYTWIIADSNGAPGTIAIDAGSVEVLDGAGIHANCNPNCVARPKPEPGVESVPVIRIDANSILVDRGGNVSASTFGAGDAGDIEIRTSSLELRDGGQIVARGLTGDGGDIAVDADTVVIGPGHSPYDDHLPFTGDGSGIFTTAFGTGAAGAIRVYATESIVLSDANGSRFDFAPLTRGEPTNFLGIASGTGGGGPGGAVELSAPDIVVKDGAWVTTGTLRASDGGPILITADRIRIEAGGQVSATTMFFGGRAGDVTLVASESIEVSGHSSYGDPSQITATTLNRGHAGDINLTAPRIVLDDGGIVGTAAVPIKVGPEGGTAGQVTLVAPGDDGQVIVRGGGWVGASTFGSGAGGSVDIRAGASIRIEGERSLIASRTGAAGDGGDVVLRAPRIEIVSGGKVSAESAPGLGEVADISELLSGFVKTPPAEATGDAGSVTLTARDVVHLDAGTISTSVGSAAGGNITIDPTFLILDHGSQIVATAGTGTGGHISIDADHFFAFPGTVVSAASGNPDLSGTVEIASPDVDLAGSLTALPSTFLDAASLMQQRCAARRGGERAGSFAVHGAGGIPAEPDGWLPAPVVSDADAIAALPGPMLASAACP